MEYVIQAGAEVGEVVRGDPGWISVSILVPAAGIRTRAAPHPGYGTLHEVIGLVKVATLPVAKVLTRRLG